MKAGYSEVEKDGMRMAHLEEKKEDILSNFMTMITFVLLCLQS